MEKITVVRQDGIVTVRLANPPLNMLTRPMMRELQATFVGFAADRDVRAVVLAAEGDRAFCAGLDLNRRLDGSDGEGVDREPSPQELLDHGRLWRETQWAVRHCPVPVIAAVEGAAVGGGFGLVGVCDIIFASERARFGLTEINVGLLGGASKALRMLGPFKARTLFFTGELLPASELYRLGAVEEVTPPGQAEARALTFAQTLAQKSPIAMRLSKESIVRIENMGLEEAYRTEQDYTVRLSTFNDAREAMAAWVEKREPHWTWT
jgi:enoyl-CoA hydratase/carnithine racemase